MTIGKHRDLLGCQKNVCSSMTYWKYLTSIEWSNQNRHKAYRMSLEGPKNVSSQMFHIQSMEASLDLPGKRKYSGVQSCTVETYGTRPSKVLSLRSWYTFIHVSIWLNRYSENCPNYLITEGEQESQEQHGAFLQRHLKNPCLTKCVKNNHAFNSSKSSPQVSWKVC